MRTGEQYETCVNALKSFVDGAGFDDVVIGLSGGMDSSLVAVMCVDALGAERVHGGWLPFYMVLLPALQLHLGIGFYRLGVKYGYITAANRAKGWKLACLLMGGLIVLGLCTLARHYFLIV